jgi:hypothetical protein
VTIGDEKDTLACPMCVWSCPVCVLREVPHFSDEGGTQLDAQWTSPLMVPESHSFPVVFPPHRASKPCRDQLSLLSSHMERAQPASQESHW